MASAIATRVLRVASSATSAAAPPTSRINRGLLVASRRPVSAARSFVVRAASKEIIAAPEDKAPAALGPYSQAVKVDSTLYVSGCIGLVPGTKDFKGDDVASQTEQVMSNMGAILEAAGSGFDKVVKTTVLLAEMSDFATVNEIYGKSFPENPPARACFAVKELPLGALVEIDAIAIV